MTRVRHEPRQIFVHAGRVVVRARLFETPLAGRIWSSLPIYDLAIAGKYSLSLAMPADFDAGPLGAGRAVVTPGELAYLPATKRILIGCGASPGSCADDVRSTDHAYVWGAALDDVRQLACLPHGQSVALLEAAS